MASAWGVAEGIQAVADCGPPPQEWGRLCRWLAAGFGLDTELAEALPFVVLGAYFVLPALCRHVGLIAVRAGLPPPTRRWVALHELGHHLTATAEGFSLLEDGWYRVNRPAERAADACAAALALPDGDALWEALRGGATITEVAAEAGIPERGALLRCKQLGIAPRIQLAAARWGLADWPDAREV